MKLSEQYMKMMNFKRKLSHPFCSVIIAAAGNSSRMNGTDKILADLQGMPVICRTLEAFEHNLLVDEIIVVTAQEKMSEISSFCAQYPKARIVLRGGENRVDSVLAGLEAVSEKAVLVAVHDGARPLVSDDIITKTIERAAKFGAAAPAVPVRDTIKVSESGTVISTPDRSHLFAVQTPQVFDADLLRVALHNAKDREKTITDDCSAVEAVGMKIQLTEGSEENLKITTPLDLEVADLILSRRALI